MTAEEEDKEYPELTYQNRLKILPVPKTEEEKLQKVKEHIAQSAMTATCVLDLQILHSQMDDLLKFNE